MNKVFDFLKIIMLFSLFLFGSCNKENPVEPTLDVGVGGLFRNAFLQKTILQVDLLFDGTKIGSISNGTGVEQVGLSGVVASVKKGAHTVSFKIVNQTSNPTSYETVAVQVTAGGSHYNLTGVKQTLSSGESITLSVDIQ